MSDEQGSRGGRPADDDAALLKRQANLGPVSAALHVIGTLTAKAVVAPLVALGVAVFLIALWVAGFPEGWQTGFATVSGAITVIMVFVIQHTQSRQQLVTQLKLDELLHSSPDADDRAVHLEAADDDELARVEHEHLRHHSEVRQGGANVESR